MSTTGMSLAKNYCSSSGIFCEFANLNGFCKLTACCMGVSYDNKTVYKAEIKKSVIIVETWKIFDNPNGDRLQIAYMEDQFNGDKNLLEEFRNNMAEMHECRLGYLIRTDKIENEE